MQQLLTLRRQLHIGILAFLAGSVLWLGALLITIVWAAPPLDRSALLLPQNVVVLDREGNTLSRFFDTDDRSSLTPEAVPPLIRDSIVAVEDRRFFERSGCIDLRAIARAAMHNANSDSTQGGSTITQQLVRNLYLTTERTYTRKLQELWLACRMERTLSKEEILTLYLNRIGFGGPVYGIEQAAQIYFGAHASQLTLAQAAVLAALPQQPSSFAPGGERERTVVDHDTVQAVREGKMLPRDIPASAIRTGLLGRFLSTGSGSVFIPGRVDRVLDALEERKVASPAAVAQARKELQTLVFRRYPQTIVAPHFSSWIRNQANNLLGSVEQPSQWVRAGLTVHTTLDPKLQDIAEQSIMKYIDTVHAQGGRDVALVALDRRTREILAYVGNINTPDNIATAAIDMARAPRQPGSSIKPLLYAFAFEHGYAPDTIVEDTPLQIGADRPKNYEGGFMGYLSIKNALARSRNIPAIRVFLALNDEDGFLSMLSRAGVPTPQTTKNGMLATDRWFSFGWPLAIGSAELPLLELTTGYATLADEGRMRTPQSICRITDRQGGTLFTFPHTEPVQAISSIAAAQVDSIIGDATLRPQGFWHDVLTIDGAQNAAKTGTSNQCLQRNMGGKCLLYAAGTVWTEGYTDDLVVGVLVGNADNSPMTLTADGLTVAAPIWHEFLQRATQEWRGSATCR